VRIALRPRRIVVLWKYQAPKGDDGLDVSTRYATDDDGRHEAAFSG
jgi:hypothetical protein